MTEAGSEAEEGGGVEGGADGTPEAAADVAADVSDGGSIVGCYAWNANGVNMISANGTMTKYCSPSNTQVCDTGVWMQTGLSNGDLIPVGGSNAGQTATPTACP